MAQLWTIIYGLSENKLKKNQHKSLDEEVNTRFRLNQKVISLLKKDIINLEHLFTISFGKYVIY